MLKRCAITQKACMIWGAGVTRREVPPRWKKSLVTLMASCARTSCHTACSCLSSSDSGSAYSSSASGPAAAVQLGA